MWIFKPWKYKYRRYRIRNNPILKQKLTLYFWRLLLGLVEISFFMVFFYACSAAKHIDKAVMKESPKYVVDYIVGKYGDSYLPKIKDTLIDTIYVRGTHVDTFRITNKIDTIILSKDNVITKVFRHYDTIWVRTDVRKDTIVRVVYRDRYVVSPQKEDSDTHRLYHFISSILDIILIGIVIVAIITMIMKIHK